MRQVVILLAFMIFIGMNSHAQEGIVFTEGTWFQILDKAKKEDKVIFMDAYTTWCGPCKKMARETFTQESVGDFFNTNFINVKMNMEKGEGIQLAREYRVRAYPTLLFIDGDGKEVHRALGYHDGEKFLEVGNVAADPSRRTSSMDARYEKGERNPEFLYNYAMMKFNAMDPMYDEIANAYMETQDDWMKEGNMNFIFKMANSSESKLFDFMIENRSLFEKQFGERAIAGKIQNMISQELAMAEGGDILGKAKSIFSKVYPEEADFMYSQFKVAYYGQMSEWQNFAQAAVDHYDKYTAKSADELNNIAWTFYEEIDNKKQLKCALKWSKQAVEMENNYYNHDTLAALYYKLGKKGKAKKTALAAIELAKKEGEDYSITEELLRKIEG